MIYFAYVLGCLASGFVGWYVRPFVEDWMEALNAHRS